MGVDAGDFDNDGDEDLFITNWLDQMNILYVNDGTGNFEDRSAASGSVAPSLANTGFGTAWFDFDNDGWLDLLVVNGGVATIEAQARANDPFPLQQTQAAVPQSRQRPVRGRHRAARARCSRSPRSAAARRSATSTTTATSTSSSATPAGPLRLLVNNVGNRNHWLGLRLVGRPGGRATCSARASRSSAPAQPTLWRRARADGSYASANDPRVLVGLGASTRRRACASIWPGGRTEEWPAVAIDRYTTLKEGRPAT